MADLRERLSAHITSTAYIKGWEVDKRKCVGAKRASLRRAARQAKEFSTGGWNTQRQRAVEKLMTELAAAGEGGLRGSRGRRHTPRGWTDPTAREGKGTKVVMIHES